MNKVRFSIVTCTYDPKPEHLEKALNSVETQTFKDFEHIINDSYSNHITSLILSDYIKRNSEKYRIKFFQTKPQGVAKALNQATEKAEGEIIHFLHSDDFYKDKNSLNRVNKYFMDDTVWLTGNFMFKIKDKIFKIPLSKLLKINPQKILSTFIWISHENTFMKTELIKKYGGFNEKVKGPVEYRLWLRMIKKESLKTVDDVFTISSIHNKSTSRGNIKAVTRSIKECFQILRDEKIGPFVDTKKLFIQTKNKIVNETKHLLQ